MSIKTELQDALAELRQDLDEDNIAHTFTYRSVSYPCIVSTERIGLSVVLGGFERTVELSVIVSTADLPIALTADSTLVTVDSTLYTADMAGNPFAKRKASVTSKEYRIGTAGLSPAGSHWEIDLVNKNL